ncbi:MAG: carbohydrate-binding domain-containing protein, partial [Ruminococcus sp.]|nr:carbohydrate-binding domain-containing protein [Ruminococcus sp.]
EKMKKLISIILVVMIVMSVSAFAVYAEDETNVITITEEGTYDITSDCAKLIIDGVKATVVLNDADMSSTDDTSAITVKNNADVSFVLKGTSNIMGNPDSYTCGIEVEYGSGVSFNGEGTLNVTGGKYGAAIGSYGTATNIPENERVKVGTITINGGTINAFAGVRGAGIGAGYHVNGNLITINGGIIHAYGRECGAGIGCGYGTSGGAIGVAAVGEYDSGSIIINGGEVYASAYYVDNIENFDYSDLAALNAQDPCTFAAGIGGGYGASASDIQINGGKVFALGSGGGAGIGAGRGSSKAAKYNQDAYKSNIKIAGNAEVTAVTADSRTNEINSGGAAIGSGRGSHTGGNIEIIENAKVTAISATQAPAVGASKQASPVDGATPVAESIVIGDNVQLFAASAGAYAVDKDAKEFSVSPDFFGSSDRFYFGEDAVAIDDVKEVKVESPKGEMKYTAPAGTVSVWTRIKAVTDPETGEKKASLGIVTPLAMAVRFEDGSVYYSGDTVEIEIGKEYKFQMCCVDWSIRDLNGEKKIHKPYEVFTPEHGIYSDEGVGLKGSVVYRVKVSSDYKERSYDKDNRLFILPRGDAVLRTDVNKCFMAYRFSFKSGDYNKQTGIDKVVYDTGVEHTNTLEDFRYNKPLEYLSVNLPLGSTVKAIAYNNYEKIGEADVFVKIDEENPDRSYTDYIWDY